MPAVEERDDAFEEEPERRTTENKPSGLGAEDERVFAAAVVRSLAPDAEVRWQQGLQVN